jgi:hypothetical protein
MNQIIVSARKYCGDARSDFTALGVAASRPLSRRLSIACLMFTGFLTFMLCFNLVFAASTPLFQTLQSAVTSLYNDANGLVETVAMFALVISIIGVFVASMFGAKATSVMTSALKLVIFFFIFWQLIPVVLTTIKNLFGSGGGTGTGA